MLIRRGATLAELLVALVLATTVLGVATRSVLTQQRGAAGLGASSADDAQRRAARGAFAADVASASADDVFPSASSDSTLQLRGLVASGLACDDAVGSVTIAPPDIGVIATGGVLSIPRIGDSLWWRSGGGGGSWRATRVAAVSVVRVACAGFAPDPDAAYRIGLAADDTVAAGAPLRVTRQIRYAVYRSSDGTRQLGLAEWSEAAHAMGAPQPLAGPFERESSGRRTGFRYFDRDGREHDAALGAGVAAMARVRLTLIAVDQAGRASGGTSIRLDSIDVALAHGAGPR